MDSGNVIGAGIRVRGKVRGGGPLTVDGTVEGDVELDGDVLVGPSGVVRGNVRGQDVKVLGDVHGDVRAARTLSVGSGGSVQGTLEAPTVVVHARASLKGRLAMPLDLPSGLDRGRASANRW